MERHRFLALLIERLAPVIATSRAVLDVAPQPQIQHLLRSSGDSHYVGFDREGARKVDVVGDLCRMPFRTGRFDLIVCYHVLEHITDDRAAMSELARVLMPGGFALIQVPQRQGVPTDEDPTASREERIRRFSQADHVRYYGEDFADRLESSGLRSWVTNPGDVYDESMLRHYGLLSHQPVWLCRRVDGGRSG